MLAWAVIYKEAWEDNITTFFGTVKDALSEVLPEMQPRWLKGMTTVILTYAIVSLLDCINSFLYSHYLLEIGPSLKLLAAENLWPPFTVIQPTSNHTHYTHLILNL